jgi:hypothetical protein
MVLFASLLTVTSTDGSNKMIDEATGRLVSDIERAIQSELRVQQLDSPIIVCRSTDSLNLTVILIPVFSRSL